MCDWSAEGAKTRKAEAGDALLTGKIGEMGHTTGLLDPADLSTAVCCLPGTRLIISGVPQDLQSKYGIGEVVSATFMTRTLMPSTPTYRDGFILDGAVRGRLPLDGIVILQYFPLGLEVSIESVPGEAREVTPAEHATSRELALA